MHNFRKKIKCIFYTDTIAANYAEKIQNDQVLVEENIFENRNQLNRHFY